MNYDSGARLVNAIVVSSDIASPEVVLADVRSDRTLSLPPVHL